MVPLRDDIKGRVHDMYISLQPNVEASKKIEAAVVRSIEENIGKLPVPRMCGSCQTCPKRVWGNHAPGSDRHLEWTGRRRRSPPSQIRTCRADPLDGAGRIAARQLNPKPICGSNSDALCGPTQVMFGGSSQILYREVSKLSEAIAQPRPRYDDRQVAHSCPAVDCNVARDVGVFSASAVVPQLTLLWQLDDSGRAWLTMSFKSGSSWELLDPR